MRGLLFAIFVFASTQVFAEDFVDCENIREEVSCLACNVYHEARGEPDVGQFAVAVVTKNRVESDMFPDSFCEVVWQPSQFSWTSDGRSDRARDQESWDTAVSIAEIVHKSYEQDWFVLEVPGLDEDSKWFHTTDVRPAWRTSFDRVATIGNHTFYTMQ